MFISMLMIAISSATMVEFIEDAYVVQAPQEIVSVAQEAAKIANFGKTYEVIVPKKAGLQINPWNRFIASVANGATGNWCIIVNPEWFSTLPYDQQIFLMVRCFTQGSMGMVPPIQVYISWFFIILSWIVAYCIYRLLSRIHFIPQNIFVYIVLTAGIMYIFNMTFFHKIQSLALNYSSRKHDTTINIATIKKTGDFNAAIQALKSYDEGLKKQIKGGEQFFVPCERYFEDMVQELTVQKLA